MASPYFSTIDENFREFREGEAVSAVCERVYACVQRKAGVLRFNVTCI